MSTFTAPTVTIPTVWLVCDSGSTTDVRRRHRCAPADRAGRDACAERAQHKRLEPAHGKSSGRSASTVYGGHEHQLRRTVIALTAGQTLAEDENPGEATMHVLAGRVRLTGRGHLLRRFPRGP